MDYVFDGANKRIVLGVGNTLDVRDAYSKWKEWMQASDNTKYLPAFSVVGGDPVDAGAGVYITSYFFLVNGWRVRPDETNYALTVSGGVLLTEEGADPFVQTVGAYNVLVRYSQPIKSETITTGGSNLTPGQIWQHVVENNVSAEGAMRIIMSAVQGLLTIDENGVVRTRDLANTKDRLVVETDINNQRTAVTRDAS